MGTLWSDSGLALGSRSMDLGKMVQEPRARFKVAKWGVFCHSAWLQISPARLKPFSLTAPFVRLFDQQTFFGKLKNRFA